MPVIVNLLIWVHLLALAMGFAGGIAMSQIGPRLSAAAPDDRATWWPLANTFTAISHTGLMLLLVTGPLILWLKYQGAVSTTFNIKMGLVLLAIVAIGVSSWGKARLKRGDERGAKVMAATGPVIMLLMLGVVLSAVFAFG